VLVQSVRVAAYFGTVFRRTWRGTVVTTFINPIFFLLAMGLGLGSLVDANGSGIGGVPYLSFVAPALLATTAMQTGAVEASWPVLGNIKYTRSYYVMLATPLDVGAIVLGQLGWAAVRLTQSATAYFLVMTLFGATHSPWGILAVPSGVLTGLAFGAPLMSYTATIDRESSLVAIQRFGLIPLFLFSGTFFPVTQLAWPLRVLAYASPLWHGVELCRRFALGRLAWWVLAGHAVYLVAFAVAGGLLATRNLRRRLVL
jgi:lipooligosaccharide transport system permease protein